VRTIALPGGERDVMAESDDSSTSGGGKRPRRRRNPVHGNPAADPVQVHRDYVERRLWSGDDVGDLELPADEGSAPAPGGRPDDDAAADADADAQTTPDDAERYARALDQWHRLPGAVSTPPTEVPPVESPPEHTDDDTADEPEES
jgi:hypothetical protein